MDHRAVREPRAETRRDVIALHAARLFARRGFLGASLRDLADECGIRQPTLYHHFPSKEAMFVDVVHRYFDIVLPELHAASAIEGDGARRLRVMIEVSVDVGTRHSELFLATSNNWEFVRENDDLRELVDRRNEALATWRAVLEDGARDGSLRAFDSHDALWVIYSAINGMIDLRFAESNDEPPPVQTLLAIVMDGLVARDARS